MRVTRGRPRERKAIVVTENGSQTRTHLQPGREHHQPRLGEGPNEVGWEHYFNLTYRKPADMGADRTWR